MFEIQSKLKRQVEILGLCLGNVKDHTIKTFDLADYFGVEELTIKRDLQDLRSYGIDIHSSRKNGVCISSPINKDKIAECIVHYTGINHPNLLSERSTILLVEQRGEASLKNIIQLQVCIDRTVTAKIVYNKEGKKSSIREINPILIYQSEGSWRVLSFEQEKVKQYLITKIESVEITNNRFKRISEEKFEELFRYSWKSWLDDKKYKIKLELSKFWADSISPRMLAFDQKITPQSDSSFIFEATVNSFNEIAAWIVARGKGMKVLEPEGLKKQVINLAQETLNNYQ
jgi:predicted DNA-binding transcriptional regulator YafY